jgi:L-ascorbate metabolism protein UlaG (beta-lactamase superfamily)
MNRRQFIQHSFAWLVYATFFNLLLSGRTAASANKRIRTELPNTIPTGLSLEEIAVRKLHHSTGGRFLNPLGELHRRKRFGKLVYWKLFSQNRYSRYMDDQPIVPVDIDWGKVKDHSGLSVTFIKHASIMINDLDRYILVDPVFDKIFWFIDDYTPIVYDFDEMPKPDHILITHGHYDHLDIPSLRRMEPDSHIISPLGYNSIFNSIGMKNRTKLDWYEAFQGNGRKMTLLPCNHWTMRNPIQGPNTSLWGSYLIETASGHTIYLSGDTGWFEGFDQIGRDFEIDLAIINLGAYEPRWFMETSHMNPAETIAAFKQLNAKKLLITHWGTFRLGDEPVHFPPLDLRKELEKEGLADRWVALKHGETLYYSDQ